jgi:hypothetical protein
MSSLRESCHGKRTRVLRGLRADGTGLVIEVTAAHNVGGEVADCLAATERACTQVGWSFAGSGGSIRRCDRTCDGCLATPSSAVPA